MNVKGTVAVVTGAASGLGAGVCRRLVAHGATVVALDRDEERGASLAGQLGDAALFVRTDVTDPAEVEAALVRAKERGPLRVAVSCAGVGWAARTVDKKGAPHDLALFQKVVGINLVGTFNVLRLAAAAMAAAEPDAGGARGVIVNTASIAAFEGQVGQIAYAASKAGVVGMTLPAARDLAPLGIRVATIAPGVFDTPMLGGLPEPVRTALAQNVVFPVRLGSAEDFAALVQHIVENDYVNGETIRLDGALRMGPK